MKSKLRMFAGVFAVFMAVFALNGCGAGAGNTSEDTEDEKISVVATVFPVYDWTREILGDVPGAELTLLLDNGTDMHSFQPGVEDIRKITDADLFIYVGGESDDWVSDTLAGKESASALNLLEALGDAAKEEETVEGMEAEEDEEGDGGEDGAEYDEHVWLSLKNADTLSKAICETLSETDPENAETYMENAAVYSEKLEALDNEYEEAVNGAELKTLLFADRFPFRYLVDDYGLSYYAAFSGCSAETEASFKTIAFLSEKIDELGLKTIFTLEKSDGALADTVIENTESKNAEIAVLDSMQSVTASDIEDGVTYISVMEKNLSELKKALD